MKAFGLGLCQEKLLKADKRQVNVQFRIGRRDKIGITRHIMMHQVLYMQLPNEEDDIHII